MPEWLKNGVDTIVAFVPKLALFLVILIIGWIVAKILAKVTNAILEKVGFDRAIERGGLGKAMDSFDASDLAAKLVYYAVLLIALQLAFGVFGPNPVSELITGIIAFLPKLFIALLIVVIGSAIAGAVGDLIRSAAGGIPAARIGATVARVFIIGLAVIAALNQMGIAITVTLPVLVTVLATVGGIAIVGVGGGLIAPMRQRWEQWLTSAEREGARVREQQQRAADTAHIGDFHEPGTNGSAPTHVDPSALR